MSTRWELQRGYASLIHPRKDVKSPPQPITYSLKLESEFRIALTAATEGATHRPMSAVVFKMKDSREHDVRELVMKLAFGQTRTPLPTMVELATRLASCTDRRTGSSLLLLTIEENGPRRRVSMYVFPEEESYTLRHTTDEATEAFLERLQSFVLQSRLRKVARFEGKNIPSHFMNGEVVDMQIGSSPRTAADYWVTAFLDAEFAITTDKGTRLVAAGLKRAFEYADVGDKQSVMEAATVLMASGQRVWSLNQIAKTLVPESLRGRFLSVAQNAEACKDKFTLGKDLLRDRINYRIFQLDTGVWVSSPFQEIGRTVCVDGDGKKRKLTAHGLIVAEKMQRDAKRHQGD